jgi:hypothetical protein
MLPRADALLCLSLIWCSVASSEALTLMCHQPNFTCPGTSVSCECQGVLNIRWTVLSASGSELAEITIGSNGAISGSSDDYTAVLCDVSGAAPNTVLTAKLNFSLSGNIDVRCSDNGIQGPANATLQMASKSFTHKHVQQTLACNSH